MVPAVVPAVVAPRVWEVIEIADTNGKRHAPSYWKARSELLPMQTEGLAFLVADVPTLRCETQGAKPLLDAAYREHLTDVLASVSSADCRIVIENYGVGRTSATGSRDCTARGPRSSHLP